MRKRLLVLWLLVGCSAAFALTGAQRRELLDAIRPEATRQAGQPVRFSIDRLNHSGDWALIVGTVLAQEGKVMDWDKAEDCNPSLDKMLWVVARKSPAGWRVEEMNICAAEPPYWDFVDHPAAPFSRPCGLYAGLATAAQTTAEQECKAYRKRQSRASR